MKNQLGMNLLLWGIEMTDEHLPMLELIKNTGYDLVEIPIIDFEEKKWQKWRAKLDELGLKAVAETINGPGHNAIAASAIERQKTLDFNKKVLDSAAILGAPLLIGPIHSALGVFTGSAAIVEEKKWAVEHLHALAEHAASLNITLGLEYLNRFESYLVSCADELIELCDNVAHPSCKMMFDTFHANIEEENLADAVKRIGDRLVHVQLSENNRSTLGSGHVNFESVIGALKEINYTGAITVEAFSTRLSAAHIWRKMFDSEEQLTMDSFAFLKKLTA